MSAIDVGEGTRTAPPDVGDEVDPLPSGPAPRPAPARGVPEVAPDPSRRRRWPRVVLWVGTGLVLVALVAATVAVRIELGDRRADAGRAEAAEARLEAARSDAALLAAAVMAQLEVARADAEVADGDRAAQVERLAALGLTEEDMDAALEEARVRSAAAVDERDALADDVERQSLEDAELQSCLAEVRPAVDAAFHAANRPEVDVPATREICRALAGLPGAP